jgi:hypothetical protein
MSKSKVGAAEPPRKARQPSRAERRHIVHEFDRDGREGERIRSSLSTFRGETYADVRLWFTNDAGELCPTRKGVCVHLDSFAELEAAVAALREAAEAEGLLERTP